MLPLDGSVWLGKYELLTRIGIGGMGEVFLARERGVAGIRRHVVVKRLIPELAEDPQMVGLFIDEAAIIAQLAHPNTVQLYEFEHEGAAYFLAMEYVPGASLDRIMQRAGRAGLTIEPPAIAYAMCEVARGLHYVHTARDTAGHPLEIVHRDVSPHNILISRGGSVKVMDFGIARAANRRQRTRTGTVRGKVGYMSPEQVTGRALDHRTDIFSAGIVLFEYTLNRRLFEGSTELELMRGASRCQIPQPTAIDTSYAPDLEQVVLTALAQDPADRFATAADLADALDGYIARFGSRSRWAARWGEIVTATFPPTHTVEAEAEADEAPRRTQSLHQAPEAASPTATVSITATAISPTLTSAVAEPSVDIAWAAPVRSYVGLWSKTLAAALILGALVFAAWQFADRPDGRAVAHPIADAGVSVEPQIVRVQEELRKSVDAGVVAPQPTADAPTSSVREPSAKRVRSRPRRHRAVAKPDASAPAAVAKPQVARTTLDASVPRAPVTGRLAVSADPWGEVSIDGRPVGPTDLQVTVESGEHRVDVDVPGRVTMTVTTRVEAGGKTKCRVAHKKLVCTHSP